jgi:hypothetical protein
MRKAKIKELDIVELTENLQRLPKGTQGTVVFIYPDSDKVEVEFVDENGNTISVENVSVELLRRVRKVKKNRDSVKSRID